LRPSTSAVLCYQEALMFRRHKGWVRMMGRPVALPPGELIREEIDARGWSQAQFARVLGRPLQAVNQIINGRKRVTPQTALEIASALGTSPEVWLNLESAYQLARAKRPDPRIARRARRLVLQTD